MCKDPSDIKRIVALPNGADRTRWIYEHLRRFIRTEQVGGSVRGGTEI